MFRETPVVSLFPEVDEAEDFLRLFALAQISVRVTESPTVGILGQENGCLTVLGEAIRPNLPGAPRSLVVRGGETRTSDSGISSWDHDVGFFGIEILSDGCFQSL
jgi:hypothetical protein